MTGQLLAAGLHLARDLHWRILPVKCHDKPPATEHGVLDATSDERQIRRWWARNPDYNLGVACGAPGPQVLDIDKLVEAAAVLKALEALGAPESATARGRHLFLAGIARATISLGYGELRGQGSYVVVPPSVHPSGKLYTWLVEPDGHKLPPVPAELLGQAQPAGTGIMPERAELVPHGERHGYLTDVATRLVKEGFTDVPVLEGMLRVAYEIKCEQTPAARADEFAKLARWASHTRIAARERNRAEHRERQQQTAAAAVDETDVDELDVDASAAEHRAFVHRLAGLPADIEIGEVRRFGPRQIDGMQIHLSTGEVMDFARQSEASQRGTWQRAIVGATGGRARPRPLKEIELIALYSALCRLSGTPRSVVEAEALDDRLREFLSLCEPVRGHTLDASVSRFTLIDALRQRDKYDPFDRVSLARPALVVDSTDGSRYLRGGELYDFYRQRGAGLSPREFPGRMAMIGLAHVRCHGRETMPLDPGQGRRTANCVLYRLGEAGE